MEYQKGKFSFVLQKDRNAALLNLSKDKINMDNITRPAAMVFDEAARLSYELRQLWPHASALTPKVPAQSRCQTKCSDPPSLKRSR